MYEYTNRVGFSQVDPRGQLNLHGIVNFLQDCSTFQSEDLGVGVDALHSKNLVWVLANWNIEVNRYPRLGEKITIGTFPYHFKNCFGMRNFFVKDDAGEYIVMADSLWTLVDYKSGELTDASSDIVGLYGMSEKLPMTYTKGRIRIPSELEEKEPIKVSYRHLDMNYHVNNGRFVEMVLPLVPVENYRRLRVEYRKQVREGQILIPYIGKNGDSTICLLQNEDKEKCTVLEFEL